MNRIRVHGEKSFFNETFYAKYYHWWCQQSMYIALRTRGVGYRLTSNSENHRWHAQTCVACFWPSVNAFFGTFSAHSMHVICPPGTRHWLRRAAIWLKDHKVHHLRTHLRLARPSLCGILDLSRVCVSNIDMSSHRQFLSLCYTYGFWLSKSVFNAIEIPTSGVNCQIDTNRLGMRLNISKRENKEGMATDRMKNK